MHKYTEEEKQFLVDNAKGILASELTRLFNEKFGTELRPSQIRSAKKRYRIKNGVDTRFKKGEASPTKGMKFPNRKNNGQFKKGNVPHNVREIGSERIGKDGQIEVKVADSGRWKLKNRIVWEQHYGEIPKGYVVHMRDGDKSNCDINNLVLLTKEEMILMNNKGFLYKNEEIFKSGLAMVDLIMKIREKERQKRKKCNVEEKRGKLNE